MLSTVEMHTKRTKNILEDLPETSCLWICCCFMAVVYPCPLKLYSGGTERRVIWMLARFDGFDLIVESMFR